MKKHNVFLFFFLLVLALGAYSQSIPQTFLVMVPHNDKECMAALDDMKAQGDAQLKNFYFGCASGDHTGYAILKGKDEGEIRDMLPASMKVNAKIIAVTQFTKEQIETMHKKDTK